MIYLDGVLQDDTSTIVDSIYNDSNATFLFGSFNEGAYPWGGYIDDTMLFKRALNSDEINSIINSTEHRYETTLTDLPDGEVNFTAYAVNTLGEINYTETRTANLTAIVPPTCLKNSTYSDGSGDCDFRGNVTINRSYSGTNATYYLEAPDNYNSSLTYPLILYFHGHGTSQSVYETSYYADFRTLARARGFIVASINYDSQPGAGSWMNESGRSEVDDVLAEVMDMYNIDRYNINTMGESMGGTASLIYPINNEGHYISSALDMQGVTNFTEFYYHPDGTAYRTSLENGLNGTPSESPETWYAVSVNNHPEEFQYFKALLLYGGADTTVKPWNYENLTRILDEYGYENGTDYQLIVDETQTHSYSSIEGYEEIALDWFNSHNLTDEIICEWDGDFFYSSTCYSSQSEACSSNGLVVSGDGCAEAPAESSSSGGSAPSKVVSLASIANGETQTLTYGIKMILSFKNENHTIFLRQINRGKAEISIDVYSEKQTVSLAVGETKEVDLDGDGKLDYKISLLKIYDNIVKVDLKIEEIKLESVTQPVVNETKELVVNDEVKKDYSWIVYSVLIILVVGIGIFYLRKKKH